LIVCGHSLGLASHVKRADADCIDLAVLVAEQRPLLDLTVLVVDEGIVLVRPPTVIQAETVGFLDADGDCPGGDIAQLQAVRVDCINGDAVVGAVADGDDVNLPRCEGEVVSYIDVIHCAAGSKR